MMTRILTVVDVSASVSVLIFAYSIPILTGWVPTASNLAGRVGLSACCAYYGFLVLLNRGCCHHRLDPSCNRSGCIVLAEQGLDRIHECCSDEDVLLGRGE